MPALARIKLVKICRHQYLVRLISAAAFGQSVVGSTGGRNTLFFMEKECRDEAASADLLLGGTASRDMGPVAARGVDEFDRPSV